jgi:hypothetical protein
VDALVAKINEKANHRREQHAQNNRRRQFAQISALFVRLRFRKKQPAQKFHGVSRLGQAAARTSFEI